MNVKGVEMIKESVQVLAFVTMVKNARANSVLYKEALYKMAQKIGMSDGRLVDKYLSKCLALGLCTEHIHFYNTNSQRVVYKFIAYRNILARLLNIKKAQLRLFPLHKNLNRFKAYQEAIERNLMALNFSQQAYNLNSNFPNKQHIITEINRLSLLPVSEKTTRANRRKMGKLMKQWRNADNQIMYAKSKGHCDSIVTGCKHTAKQLGVCTTTAHKRIKKWMEQGLLEAHDIILFTPVASETAAHHLIDSLKHQGVKGIHVYSRKEKGIKTIMGKRVSKFESRQFD